MDHPVIRVQALGQSIWYDNIGRGLITSGELRDLVEEGGVLGVTSNPAIFEKAVAGSSDYDPALSELVRQGLGDAKDLYEQLAIEDIQLAADVLRPVYDRTDARDGYVSFEVSPYLVRDTRGTVEEALRLHAAVRRDNLMIKVPATEEGIPAIRELITRGISVNATLIFSPGVYEAVSEAYLEGLEVRVARGDEIARLASVASFFVSRIDGAIDKRIDAEKQATADPAKRASLANLSGQVAIANAKVAYARQRERIDTARWRALAERGARPQRLLWASTGTKNPEYKKTLYVEELIGPDTVDTVPADTFDAFRAGGDVRPSLTEGGPENTNQARELLDRLADHGICLADTCAVLLDEGLQGFSDAFDKLLGSVETKRQQLLDGELATHEARLGDLDAAVAKTLEAWRRDGTVRRLWARDASLWTGADEADWLGWLDIPARERDSVAELDLAVQDFTGAGITHLVLLGMGGSSLAPDVLRETFGRIEGYPELIVLDSVAPSQIRAVEERIHPRRTVFLVSSKSGGTVETNALASHFYAKVEEVLGGEAGSRFIAVTDPGSSLEQRADDDSYAYVFHGEPSVGGRFSALSKFGTVPAALMGIDVVELLGRAEVMVHSCASSVPPESNPGVTLGTIIGCAAQQGRDKLTIVASPGIERIGDWIEQLVAESTGKLGSGVIPITGEVLGATDEYADDRLFVYARLGTDDCPALDASVSDLEAAGQPVVRLTVEDRMDLGQAFFRWEMATAVAGAILGIHPFDQPDVESAKIATRAITAEFEETRRISDLPTLASDDEIRLVADNKNAEALRTLAASDDVDSLVAAHIRRIEPGDYFALTAFLEMNGENHRELSAIRDSVRRTHRVATTLGYGPRFLHSTGQLHKGGPGKGVFLQITADVGAEDIPVPGQRTSFGTLLRAQAQGDLEVLAERGRRVLRVHLGPDVQRGLVWLREVIEHSLG